VERCLACEAEGVATRGARLAREVVLMLTLTRSALTVVLSASSHAKALPEHVPDLP
jgi:hypothetical protein